MHLEGGFMNGREKGLQSLSLVAIVVLSAVVINLLSEPDQDPDIVYVLPEPARRGEERNGRREEHRGRRMEPGGRRRLRRARAPVAPYAKHEP